jgi:hypothetical protein
MKIIAPPHRHAEATESEESGDALIEQGSAARHPTGRLASSSTGGGTI